VSGTAAVKALKRLGFFVDRQRGSHVVLKKITPEAGAMQSEFNAKAQSREAAKQGRESHKTRLRSRTITQW
jgi:hypothetical protein